MKLYYDFHIHTALSPCGDDSMTPNNIVNMALINELDAIAITDHNTAENLEAVMKVARGKDIIVIPGIEIETKEEIHVIGLFPNLQSVYNVQNIIYSKLPYIKNKPNVVGNQYVLNENDDIMKELDRFLLISTLLSLNEVIKLIKDNNGIAVPAHIDRPSYSILSNLGFIPDDLNTSILEISRFSNLDVYKKQYKDYQIIQSSDAHELGYIGITKNYLEVKEKNIESIFNIFN
ncbi:histidinol-phosphatase [Vallitalea longa]|uniref:Histidinol-phosphatase n=1 Tax=Vallitalea longa TaxID=2936439 RepID=A0A9W5YFX3_9FIRM|nr:PHP domain-containing protein [Vallitalea longa]GKX30463.1 histidinol-phosphatase [Vallitalea longa]